MTKSTKTKAVATKVTATKTVATKTVATKTVAAKTVTTKSFTKLTVPQTQFLEQYLRGTGKTLSERQAVATYGIKNLRARMTDLRNAGLVVRTAENTQGRTIYSVSARDINGSRAYAFV